MQQWYNAPLERKEPIDHMLSLDRIALGDAMKSYEAAYTSRKAFKGQPLVVRLDGKSFHTFTRGLARPFDERLSRLMVKTTSSLVEKFQATILVRRQQQRGSLINIWRNSFRKKRVCCQFLMCVQELDIWMTKEERAVEVHHSLGERV